MFLVLTTSLWSYMTVGNVILAVFFLFLLNMLIAFYEFRGMPPGPRLYSLPVIGNIFSMGTTGSSLSENTLSLRQTYGRVFSMKLGGWKAVIASSPEGIKEVLIKKSGDFAGRPPFWSMELQTLGGKDMAMGNYGPAWKLHRKLFVTALRQYLNNISLANDRITCQAQRILHGLEEQNEAPINPKNIIMTSVANIISTITFGADYDVQHPDVSELLMLLDRILKDQKLIRTNFMLDLIPAARLFPFTTYKAVERLTEMKFQPLRRLLKEQEETFDSSKPIKSLVAGLLKYRHEMSVENDMERETLFAEEYIMNTIHDMFLGGYETTTTTLLWAIAFLVNYPKYQVQLQEHLDQIVGRNRLPSLEDRPNLPLVHATIMEVLRLGNVADAAIPHYTLKDTTLCGYRVPKDTIVFADLQSLHLDPECWENPEEFNPLRHIDSEGQLITDQGHWLPFGAGRRGCAGESLAKVEVFLMLSIMVHQFTFAPEDGESPPSLKGQLALTKSPQPYKVKAIKRM